MWKRRVGHIGGRRSRRRDGAERRSGAAERGLAGASCWAHATGWKRSRPFEYRAESAVVGIAGAVSAVRCCHHNPHEMEVVQHTLWQSLCSKPMWIVVTTVPAMIRRVGPHRNGEPRTLELTRVPRPGPGRPPPPPTSVPPLKRPAPSRHAPSHLNAHKHNPRSAIISTYAHKYAHTRGGTRPPCHLAPR